MKNIGVFFGGKSPEHDVSIITGQLIISELKKMFKYKVVPVYISKDGEWHISDELGVLKFFSDKNKDEALKKFSKYYLDLEQSNGKMVFKKKGLGGGEITVDLAFPAFHGENGEDGTIQGLFEILGVPYAGCDVATSAMAMDKILTKLFYSAHGILTANFIFFDNNDWEKNKDGILKNTEEKLKYPMFVKPPKLGSSIGITKVKNKKDLEFAIEVALHYGERVLVEEGVENLKDITCAVLGGDDPQASLAQEFKFGAEFLDYEEKYLKDGGSQLGDPKNGVIIPNGAIIPAHINDETTKLVQGMAVKIFKLFRCWGISRIDFLYDERADKLYANEINTLPGVLYNYLWVASGIELKEVIENMIKIAQDRFKNNERIKRTFDSELLKQANSSKLQIKKNL